MVYITHAKTFYHLDSSSGLNTSEAKVFSSKLSKYLGTPCQLEKVDVSQQSNGYDCGGHCIANMEKIANVLTSSDAMPSLNTIRELKEPISGNLRRDLHELILNLSSNSPNWLLSHNFISIFQRKLNKIDQKILLDIMDICVSGVGAVAGVAAFYKLVRPYFPVKVNCHFCNHNFKVNF